MSVLEEAEQASMRARDLSQQLLTFARGGSPVKEHANIAPVIKESAKFACTGSPVRCEINLPQDIWPTEIDPGQMSQVIQNLVINAIQAMPEGGVVRIDGENVRLDGEAKSNLPLSPGKYIRISVKDQGVGIWPDQLSKIFDPYFTTKEQGSGLGLSTVYSTLKNHGGYITADSTPSKGTTFTFYLPAFDGVDTRDPGDEGKWLSIGYNTLEEIQVLGPGAPAEYGAFSGAVFNALRRSGGNRFEGLFEVLTSSEGLASDNVDAELLEQNPALGDPAVTSGLLDLNAQLGGPIRKDKLFFFLSGQRAKLESDPSGPRTFADTLDYRVDAKLTWLPGRDHVSVGLFYNREDICGQPGVPASVATDDLTSSWHKPDWNWYGQWRRVFGTRTLLEAKYTGWTGVVESRPQLAEPLRQDLATGGNSGGSGSTLTAEFRTS